jgi:hypothetical protein
MTQGQFSDGADDSANEDEPGRADLPSSLIENARIEEDRRRSDRLEPDRRRSARAAVDATASLCISLRSGFEGRLNNLSADGCSLQLTFGSFMVGDLVWFRIESIQPWRGTVRWVNGDKVGVEFERPFYPAVFELLVKSHQPVTVSRAA